MNFSVLSFGADPTGAKLSTFAIQKAIDEAALTGGRVTVPSGLYKTGTLWLKSNIELHLEMGAKLLASEDLSDYNEENAYPQNFRCNGEEWNGKHLIIAHEVDNIAITGLGCLDGNAEAFFCEPIPWDGYTWEKGLALAKDKVNLRPGQLIAVIECKNVVFQDITVQNSTCWCCFFHGCENVSVRGVKIFNPPENANTDGIDIDTCSDVTVSDCIIDTGDDAIALRCDGDRVLHREAVCENITVSNCVLASSSSVFRIGVGRGVLRHIRVDNIVMKRGAVGMCFMGCWTPGKFTDIYDTHFSRISAAKLSFAFQINSIRGAELRDISITDMRAVCCAMSSVSTDEPGTLKDIRLENVHLKYFDKPLELTSKALDARGDHLLCLKNAQGITLRDVTVNKGGIDSRLWKGTVFVENCSDTSGEVNII